MADINYFYANHDFNTSIVLKDENGGEPESKFDTHLKASWLHAMRAGHFQYELNINESKFLPGSYSFFAQLNVDRGTKRRTPQHILSMTQLYDPTKFNFTKVNGNEVIFKLMKGGFTHAKSPDVLVINVSPLEFGHSLLIPQINDRLPQILTAKSISLALEVLMMSSSPFFRVGFNSLLGYASVNHLHFHVYYLRQNMLLERIEVNHLAGPCFELVDYPAVGFVFQLVNKFDLKMVANQIYQLTSMLQKLNVAHNMYMTRGTKLHVLETDAHEAFNAIRVYVWARTSSAGAKETGGFNPALCELFGHLNIKDKDFFEKLDECQVSATLTEVCRGPFLSVRDQVKQMFEKGSP